MRPLESAVGGCRLKFWDEKGGVREHFEVAEVADGDNVAYGRLAGILQAHLFDTRHFKVRLQFVEGHGGGLGRAHEVLADAPEVFSRERLDLSGRLFAAKALLQIAPRDAPM